MDGLLSLDPVLGHAAAATIGVVLILGALGKLRDLALFRAALDNYRLVPPSLLGAAAFVLPLLELAAGVLILPSATRPLGALLAAAVLLLVSAAVLVKLRQGGAAIDCGCGGGSDSIPLSRGLLARNAGLVALTLLAALTPAARDTVWLDALAATLSTLFLLGLYQVLNLWLSHQPRLEELRNAP